MPSRSESLGHCQYCHRELGADLRPINVLEVSQLEKLAKKLKKSTSSMNELSLATSQELFSIYGSDDGFESSVVDAMLDVVQQEFDRKDDSEISISEDQANFIVSMLIEEQLTYDQFLNKEVPRLLKAALKKRAS